MNHMEAGATALPARAAAPISASLRWLCATLVLVLASLFGGAATAADPDHVSFTLEGCRNDGSFTLPIGGEFVCDNSDYTTGNLGKGWNELDLVPHRLTASAGNAAPATQTYTVAVVLDAIDGGTPGYDVISMAGALGLGLNTALSSAACSVPAVSAELTVSPGIGGTDVSRYLLLTITQTKNTTCVYDFAGRLALGSHLYPGSSLHANLTNENLGTAGIGARDVSIPVKEILPQDLSKTMSALQNANHAWMLSKSGPASVSFGDVCEVGAPQPQPVQITVQWTKLQATAGGLLVTAQITAINPASRTITVTVTDRVYAGATQTTLLHTTAFAPVDVPANTSMVIATDSFTLNPPPVGLTVGGYVNDVATATYTDKATGIAVPGNTTAVALAQIEQGNTSNASATIGDIESLTGTGLKFSVATPTPGSFSGYTAGTPTTGPVVWNSGTQASSGSVTFNKTLYLDAKRITSGVLTDQATLNASDGFQTVSDPLNIPVSSSASVKLRIHKTIPADYGLDPGERLEVTFHVARASDPSFSQDVTLTFLPGQTVRTALLDGLVPDHYLVTETGALLFNAANPNGTANTGLAPQGGNQRDVDLTVGEVEGKVVANCSGDARYLNTASIAPPGARVQKITIPPLTDKDADYLWTFTLTGPGIAGSVVQAGAGAGFVPFPVVLQEGTYTVTETEKSGWALTSVTPVDANDPKKCSFTVDLPEDLGVIFSCSFSNTKSGKAKVIKTVSGAPPSGTQAFTFQLRSGASPTQNGTTLESLAANAGNGGVINFSSTLVPGDDYQLCELVMPGWTSTLGDFVPGSFIPPDGVVQNPDTDNSIVCVNFSVAPGETKVFTIDNRPPPGGDARTIGFWKNWASCSRSNGKQRPVLDQTLALFPIAGGQTTRGVFIGDLYVDTCLEAVRLLNKSTVDTGQKKASDPTFNLAAQLLAARLNVRAGAGTCPAAVTAINQAQALLDAVNFNGVTHNVLTQAQATQANNLATTLDLYNNNQLCQ